MSTEHNCKHTNKGFKNMVNSPVLAKKILKKTFLFLVLGLWYVSSVQAPYAANFLRAHDVGFLQLFDAHNRTFMTGALLEHGFSTSRGYDGEGKQVPVMEMYASKQSAQAMLSDQVITFPPNENPEQFFPNTVQQTYNSNWGMFNLVGKFQQTSVTLWGRGVLSTPETLPGRFSLAGYLPIKAVRVEGVDWTDLSDSSELGVEERRIGFSSRLKDFVNIVGSLDIGNWSKIGQGDAVLQLEWQHQFKQELDLIQHVKLEAALGILVPTSRMLDGDIDQIFAIPLGSNGAWGIPGKASLEVQLHERASAGVCVDALWLADVTKPRRLKTHLNQTEYLLLSKGRARMQHARTWRFSLFSRVHLPVEGLWASLSYHFAKTGDHTLIPEDNDFTSAVVNSAESLKESSSHDILFRLHFNRAEKESFAVPGLSFFMKFPVGGCRSVRNVTFGGECMFAF